MQDIAGEAGLSAGALYRYFPSKEALIRKVADTAVEVNADLFARAVSGADTPLEALINVGRDVAGWDLEAYAQDFEGMLSGRRDPAPHGDPPDGPAPHHQRPCVADRPPGAGRRRDRPLL